MYLQVGAGTESCIFASENHNLSAVTLPGIVGYVLDECSIEAPRGLALLMCEAGI